MGHSSTYDIHDKPSKGLLSLLRPGLESPAPVMFDCDYCIGSDVPGTHPVSRVVPGTMR